MYKTRWHHTADFLQVHSQLKSHQPLGLPTHYVRNSLKKFLGFFYLLLWLTWKFRFTPRLARRLPPAAHYALFCHVALVAFALFRTFTRCTLHALSSANGPVTTSGGGMDVLEVTAPLGGHTDAPAVKQENVSFNTYCTLVRLLSYKRMLPSILKYQAGSSCMSLCQFRT